MVPAFAGLGQQFFGVGEPGPGLAQFVPMAPLWLNLDEPVKVWIEPFDTVGLAKPL